MILCPKCGSKYQEGPEGCPICSRGVDRMGNNDVEDTEEWAFLMNVYNDTEAEIVKGMLEAEGIPAVIRYKGMGTFLKVYTGTVIDVDLYVPRDRLEKARKLVGHMDSGVSEEEQPAEPFRRKAARFYIIYKILAVPIIIMVIISLIRALR
ncbi:MAG: hypothetical protein HPY66_2880 [Firmicutes bacterium]|nr:hypothetical protein [Bacillota bacterium]